MAIRVDLLRPDDLLNLQVEGVNLKLDTSDPAKPALVPEDTAQPCYLVIHFPPQTIVEEAFYQTSSLKPPKDEEAKPYNQPPSTPATPQPTTNARARIGGPSRLVFRMAPAAATRIPYSLEGLLNWTQLLLSVSPVADVPETPTDEQRRAAPNIQEPKPLETAIEMPYRLVISPAHDVVWEHATGLRTHAGHTELWHTRLAFRDESGNTTYFSRIHPAPLRVLWSPDYHPNKFVKTDPPLMGEPDHDWNYPPGVLTAMTPSDRHELVVLTSAFHGFIKGLRDDFTTDYSDFVPAPIHAEQVILSPLGGWLKSRGNWRPPMPWRQFIIRVPPGRARWDEVFKEINRIERLPRLDLPHLAEHAEAERERALAEHELLPARDSELFASLERVGELWPPVLLGEHGDSLNVSEWVHIATQGRDHYVRIVYEGFLYPFRHRAALIKVTERKIDDVNGKPLAYLVQHMFVVVRQPLMDYSQERTDDEKYGRTLPFNRVRLTTLITPDIDMPAPIGGAGSYSFWVKVGGQPFKFHAVSEDIGGNQIDFTAALIFVPFSDVTSSTTVATVRDKYLKDPGPTTEGLWRACAVPGQKITYAERKGGTTDNTTITTRVLHFNTDEVGVNGAFRFRPLLFKAEVNLPAVEQILGTNAPTNIAYYDKYLANGFGAADNVTGLFAIIAKETTAGALAMDKIAAEMSADKAGGMATPNLSISALAREHGPAAGDNLAALAANKFDPNDFFKDVKDAAKIFGSFSLLDLLPIGNLGKNAPKVQFSTEAVAGKPNARNLVATLDWAPDVKSASFGIVHLNVDGGTKLTIHGRMEKVVEVPPPPTPTPPHSLFEGTLSDFTLEFLHVIEVPFKRFHFKNETGLKTQVDVDLNGQPNFKDELSFVNKLREVIPPGLFGDGASLDLTPSYVKVGFEIGLPPLSVGVFSLQNLNLGASLTLPFLNGLPLFDFHVSSREHPFNLTVAFLGGGGFFHLQVATDDVHLLEVSLEFGASASIDLGVASGGVHIMAGIYFAMGKKNGVKFAILSGYLRMGGELSVLGIISISLEFVLSFGYEAGKAAGRATLTVKVEVFCFSTSVDITVEKKFGGSSGDPKFFEVFETPAIWDEYATAFA